MSSSFPSDACPGSRQQCRHPARHTTVYQCVSACQRQAVVVSAANGRTAAEGERLCRSNRGQAEGLLRLGPIPFERMSLAYSNDPACAASCVQSTAAKPRFCMHSKVWAVRLSHTCVCCIACAPFQSLRTASFARQRAHILVLFDCCVVMFCHIFIRCTPSLSHLMSAGDMIKYWWNRAAGWPSSQVVTVALEVGLMV